ncbi:MAG: thiamine pyrophosphate-dependent dehydrogenase E1 component subunit alpha [Deltaproteobacteria bacterium]|nr:thiamine pyrophosphate-dependent dehydrogenase E1 component subunit alpha [Deltaproteobacteria bacterium]
MKTDLISLEGSDLSTEDLLRLYRNLLRVRLIEEAIAARYSAQEMRCPVHLSVGQEAAAVGACDPLTREDRIVSTHRCHGHYLAKGGDLTRMIAEIHGRATGCCGGRGGSMHLFDDDAGVVASVPIVGSSVPLGLGIALAFQQQGLPHVAVAFFGDGAVEEGALHESANLAVVHQLPLVFFLENNLYSVYTPLQDRQPERPLARFASAHELPVEEADGNDVLAVRRATAVAVERARQGEGPTLVAVNTYRWREHCGPAYDDHLGYRPEGELAKWQAACPVARFEKALTEAGLLSKEHQESFAAACAAEIETAFRVALQAPFPRPESATDHVYA